MATSLFNSSSYYRFANTQLNDATISCGISFSTNGAIDMTQSGSLSSENWQLWYQDGRYFIRNHDYGAQWQLGVTEASPYVPLLLAASADLGQQWEVASLSGGSYTLTNLLFATFNSSGDIAAKSQLALSSNGSNIFLETTEEQSGAQWTVDINTSAGAPSADMLKNLSDIQNPTTSTTTTTTLSSSTRSQTSTTTSPPASITSTSSSSTTSISSSVALSTASSGSKAGVSSHGLSAGAIAGIVIGSVAGAILFSILLALFWRRRRQSHLTSTDSTQGPHMLEADNQPKGLYELKAGNQPRVPQIYEADSQPRYR
ncbi:hypothetical protein OIDMADRAFT_34638 [Oidiodendron maius Zn]|uniref:Ricin B lectin domain-containing protein n=1 Tax=Oidiodendron maius (strain Zn) TaxID=913774 RepID=A0A0C3GET1_OIDMZ|nr:hypothetical protein OIDMADRAFT_34638 [Oidiodendron maius Zn]